MSGSVQEWATLVASSIAAVAAVASAVLAAIGAAKARRWTGRDHWWQRLVWAVEAVSSAEGADREVATEVLVSLSCVAWGQRDDNELAMRVTDLLAQNDDSTPPPSEPGGRRWWPR